MSKNYLQTINLKISDYDYQFFGINDKYPSKKIVLLEFE